MVKRLLFFVYGGVSYLIFLATFLYAAAFVGGCPAIPTRLDGPLHTSWLRALVIDCSLLTLFAVQHSVMARRWFKERWTQIVPWTIERSTFVLCASLALLLLFWQWRPLGVEIWVVDAPILRGVLWALFGTGWLTVLLVTFLINHFDLFGVRQVWLPLIGKPYTRVSFRTPLPYRFVRHPLYFGFLLAFWMTPTMTLAHLVFALTTTAYIVVAIQFEERDLIHEHGVAYESYRRRVPMLLPFRRPAARQTADASRRSASGYSALGLLFVLAIWPVDVLAQDSDLQRFDSRAAGDVHVASADRFSDPAVTQAEGYVLAFACVTGPEARTTGLYFVNHSLVADGEIDAGHPEVIIYAPMWDGGLQLIGVDYLVPYDLWHAKHTAPPQLFGEQFRVVDTPNPFRLRVFDTLHIAQRHNNPFATFPEWWDANVACGTTRK